ncbi:MAG TPA: hypothetical protein VK001_01940 [Geminicoccaceae bacterium]|nr:hypothetical protein [Geminicoccaceae bacterium]
MAVGQDTRERLVRLVNEQALDPTMRSSPGLPILLERFCRDLSAGS